jgi:hypothetical protein
MSNDMTHCLGEGCECRSDCDRWTGHYPERESVFTFVYTPGKGKGCKYYIPRKGDEDMKEFTDTELLNFLQSLNDRASHTGMCICRESTTGRGWRLHETDDGGATKSVRQAIADMMRAKK